jgi:hypothetical protein
MSEAGGFGQYLPSSAARACVFHSMFFLFHKKG